MKGVIIHSVVPVRAEAREAAEQQTQLLFAETCTILKKQPNWLRIKNDADGEEGWVDRKMVAIMDDQDCQIMKGYVRSAQVKVPMTYAVSQLNGQTIPLVAGTRLMNYQQGRFFLLGATFRIDEEAVAPVPIKMSIDNLMQVVRFFLNTPYQWGGKNALGMDCSGFTQVIMSLFGRALPRNASDQAQQGIQVETLKKAKAGDLVFFDHEDNKISHVGIVIDKERVVHCSGRVKVEKLDEQGIWNAEEGKYSHHLVAIRRIK